MEPIIQYKNIRNGYVRVSNQGKILISIPNKLKNNEAFKNALLEKGKKLLARHQKKTFILTSDKDQIQIFGEIVPTSDLLVSGSVIPGSSVAAPGGPGQAPSYQNKITKKNHLPDILKRILQEYAEPILQHYSQELGYKIKKLTIRKTKSKRGSCTSNQEISLNLSLVHLPTRFIKYVIIHEACHLKVHNHSKKFRALVEKYCPNYKLIKKEMRGIVID